MHYWANVARFLVAWLSVNIQSFSKRTLNRLSLFGGRKWIHIKLHMFLDFFLSLFLHFTFHFNFDHSTAHNGFSSVILWILWNYFSFVIFKFCFDIVDKPYSSNSNFFNSYTLFKYFVLFNHVYLLVNSAIYSKTYNENSAFHYFHFNCDGLHC